MRKDHEFEREQCKVVNEKNLGGEMENGENLRTEKRCNYIVI